jgi:hypothetical protein
MGLEIRSSVITKSNARILLIAGLMVVLLMFLTFGFGVLVWRWSPSVTPFQVNSFTYK